MKHLQGFFLQHLSLNFSRCKSCALGSYHGSAIQLPFLRVEPRDYCVGRNSKYLQYFAVSNGLKSPLPGRQTNMKGHWMASQTYNWNQLDDSYDFPWIDLQSVDLSVAEARIGQKTV